MTGFIQNILWNSVSGFVEAGTRTAGGYAGDALIKAGDMIEGSGRNIGTGIERRASNYGSSIAGQGYQPSGKALPSTAKKPALKRSNSSPAGAPTQTKAVGPTSKTPIGGNKYPGGKQAGGAKSTAGSTVGGAKSTVGGAAKSTPRSLPKAYPNNVPYGTSNKPRELNKPYPANTSSPRDAPKKTTAVKPGQPKPFNLPASSGTKEKDGKKAAPYPGTNTLPGQSSKTPVRAKTYKPMERMKPPTERGSVQHITV